MYIFQSEQVIKLRFWHKITSLLFKSYLHNYLIFFDIFTSIRQWTSLADWCKWVNSQNDRVWAKGRKKNVNASHLLIERAKFAPHLMVSAGVCYGGKGQLHFVDKKAKVNAS